MRVVIDTNVLFSGAMSPHGSPGRIIDSIISQTLTVLYDDRTLMEYREVLLRSFFGFQANDVNALVDFIAFPGQQITAGRADVVLPDTTDLPFLEVAIAGAADALITGNLKHFKPVRSPHSIQILSPADFLRLM
jgi:putative PIN family toxin of toxin-antitoxin system